MCVYLCRVCRLFIYVLLKLIILCSQIITKILIHFFFVMCVSFHFVKNPLKKTLNIDSVP